MHEWSSSKPNNNAPSNRLTKSKASSELKEEELAISNLTENLSKVQLELTLFTEDSKKEIETLRENLALAEEDRDNFSVQGKKQLL